MKIEFISAGFEQVPGVGGKRGYGKATVTYSAGGQTRTQSVISFSNPAVYSQLEGFKKGDILDVAVVKNAQGYNQWSAITKEEVGSVTSNENANLSAPTKSAPTQYVSRDFENKEERATKQALIVRQSSLSNAISILTTGAKAPPPLGEVKALADELVAYVYNVTPQPENATGFGDIPDDL